MEPRPNRRDIGLIVRRPRPTHYLPFFLVAVAVAIVLGLTIGYRTRVLPGVSVTLALLGLQLFAQALYNRRRDRQEMQRLERLLTEARWDAAWVEHQGSGVFTRGLAGHLRRRRVSFDPRSAG